MRKLTTWLLTSFAGALVLVVVVIGCSTSKPATQPVAGFHRSASDREVGVAQPAESKERIAISAPPTASADPDVLNSEPAKFSNNTSAHTNIPPAAPSTLPEGVTVINGGSLKVQFDDKDLSDSEQDALRLRRQAEAAPGGQTLGTATARPIDGGGGGRGRGGGRGGRGAFGGGGGLGGAQQLPQGGVAALQYQRAQQTQPRIIIPMANEELWIISRPARAVVMAAPGNDLPGAGALLVRRPDQPQQQVPVPLKHTDVKASISGYIATVDVTQQYQNPFSEKIEAQYVFPLPQNAAINEFLMTIGERKIRGIIRDRQEAQQIYQEARSQGYVASLLTQERPNIFTQSVANIEPGKQIDIDIKYFHTLEYVDGWYEWNFPMVVGPRFNPPYSSDGIGAVGPGARGKSGQSTEVQYLRPEHRTGHDISLAVQLDAGVKIEQIESINHRVMTNIPEQGVATVVLNPSDSIPNKDFVLRYKVAGDKLKSALMVQKDKEGNGGYFTLMLVPPASMVNLPRQPLEMVFTLDISGSMSGQPIEQSRAAIRYALQHMRPEDTFQIVRFADRAESMTPSPVPATPENIRRGLEYIQPMQAGGGTMMMEGIRQSLAFPSDESRLRFVAFLTDGYIGNEAQILGEVHKNLANSRIFSFGVGSSPNRYLLDHMAKMGAGAAAYLGLNDNPDEIMSAYFDRISHPALTDVNVDYGGMQVSDVFPRKIPDLFVGRPVIITGRFTGKGETTVRLKGRLAGEIRESAVPVRIDDAANQHRGIASVWARNKISDLADQSSWDTNTDFAGGIKQIALEYGLMSQFTSFVAVDSTARTAGDHGVSVTVPVPVPDGVRYDTTVQEGARQPVQDGFGAAPLPRD